MIADLYVMLRAGIVLSPLPFLIYNSSMRQVLAPSPFSDEATEAQREYETCLRSYWLQLGFKHRQFDLCPLSTKPCCLFHSNT